MPSTPRVSQRFEVGGAAEEIAMVRASLSEPTCGRGRDAAAAALSISGIAA